MNLACDIGRCQTAATRRLAQRGAASLVVVMVLFFVMALVAAYTNRNLIFEQRTAVNQYRSTMALEAAEAGIEWALAQLNGGRIGGNCLQIGVPSPNTSFRQRYLNIDPATGMITVPAQPGVPAQPRRAGCVWTGASWSCDCPTNNNPVLAAPAGPGLFPAFWVTFSVANVARQGNVEIIANGCTSLNAACLTADDKSTSDVEGFAQIHSLVALKSSLTTPPAAALTVFGQVGLPPPVVGAPLAAYNTATDRGGITIQASGAVNSGTFTVVSTPGTPSAASIIANDASLILPAPVGPPVITSGDRLFASVFGAWPNTYSLQPGAVVLNCPAAGCRQALADTVAMNPDRVIWINGDLTLESAGVVGSAPNPLNPAAAVGPATIVTTGNLIFTAPGVRIFGVVYARNGNNWTGSGEIQGAALSESDLAPTAALTVVYNPDVIDALRLRAGSFVKLSGGWRDFPWP